MKKMTTARWMLTAALLAGRAWAADEAPVPEAAPAETAVAPTGAIELVELVPERETPGVTDARGELISITLDNVPVQDVIRMFSRISGANIVAGRKLEGTVTVSLKDVEWEPALRIILDSVNLSLIEKAPGIFTVLSKADLALEPLTVETYTLQFQTISNLLPVVQKMLVTSNASVSGAAGVNALVIRETADQLAKIREVLAHIDKPRPQVFIEAKFVELNDQAIKDLGINWQSLQGVTLGAGGLKMTLGDSRTRKKSTARGLAETDNRSQTDILTRSFDRYGVEQDSGGSSGRSIRDAIVRGQTLDRSVEDRYERVLTDVRAAVLSASDFALVLSALKQNSGVSIVSNPKIVVASGEQAVIRVGSQRPNIAAKAIGQAEGVPYFVYEFKEWIDVGVKVLVTPVVNNESNITIRITPELSRAPRSEDEVIPQTGQRFPVKTVSTVDTEFNVENNRTVAIGGLSMTDDEEKVIKVPVLGDLPLIGKYLFRHTKTQKTQSEIIIFVTVALAQPSTMFERTGIPSEGQLIHRHLTSREVETLGVGNGNAKKGGKKK